MTVGGNLSHIIMIFGTKLGMLQGHMNIILSSCITPGPLLLMMLLLTHACLVYSFNQNSLQESVLLLYLEQI